MFQKVIVVRKGSYQEKFDPSKYTTRWVSAKNVKPGDLIRFKANGMCSLFYQVSDDLNRVEICSNTYMNMLFSMYIEKHNSEKSMNRDRKIKDILK